jgi:hypothetical protein
MVHCCFFNNERESILPSQVIDDLNLKVTLSAFITAEFLDHLRHKVWSVFLPEMAGLLPAGA